MAAHYYQSYIIKIITITIQTASPNLESRMPTTQKAPAGKIAQQGKGN